MPICATCDNQNQLAPCLVNAVMFNHLLPPVICDVSIEFLPTHSVNAHNL